MKNHTAGRQLGSALVYCLGLLVLIALSVSYSFNASRVSSEKTRLQNTADAASYSVAAVESRDLNFKAYTNRAMVANQVAIAQSVSLVSWARFIDRFLENISYIASFFPPLGAAFRGISQAVEGFTTTIETAMRNIVDGLNFIEAMLSSAQQVHHYGTVVMAHDIYHKVVVRNDPDVDRSFSVREGLFVADYIHGHENFTEQYDPENVTESNRSAWPGSSDREEYEKNKKRMDEFRAVTMKSRDGFSRNRTYKWIGPINIPPRFNYRIKVEKAGGSEMTGSVSGKGKLGDYYTWSAMDTMSMHDSSWGCGLTGCDWDSWAEALQVGWGAAATDVPAGSPGDFRFFDGAGGSRRYGSSYRINSRASQTAALEYELQNPTGRFNGLRPFYDIRDEGLISEAPGVALMLTKPHSSSGVKTVKHTSFGGGSGDLDLEAEGGFMNDRLSALSRAVPYFSRPNDVNVFQRSDGLREYGNLYNPFWQPRLAELENRHELLGLAASLL